MAAVQSATQALGLQGLMQKSLTDLVRGIRAHKKDEAQYIAQALQDIKEELKSGTMSIKTVAIQKLTYLKMLGYDISWAAFPIVEIMASTRFGQKRSGYLAASLSFHDGTEVAMLCTNLLRKDFTSANAYEAGAALSCLSSIATPDLARDLAADLVALLNTSRPYVRKRAVLALYRVFLKFPGALRPAFPRLREKLEDTEPSVQAAAVNVVCELARRNPANYLPLAPLLYRLLTTGQNNWTLIKIVKLFGALTPLEPRLSKKLAEPLTHLINTTPAISLLYECIQTATTGMTDQVGLMRVCLAKLRSFVEDPDQNLKYLGLVALHNIMRTHPKPVLEFRDLVLYCLQDEDDTIRSRALQLLQGMVSKKNLVEIVARLVQALERAEGAFREELVQKIVELCSAEQYKHLTDFEWYLGVLVGLLRAGPTQHGRLLASQLLDLPVRARPLRPLALRYSMLLLREPALHHPASSAPAATHDGAGAGTGAGVDNRQEALAAAAWILGEFAGEGGAELDLTDAIEALLAPGARLEARLQASVLHNLLKLLALLGQRTPDRLPATLDALLPRLEPYARSPQLEVQERACFALELLRLLRREPQLAPHMPALFADALPPVAPNAQLKVPLPPGLDLDTPLHPEPQVELPPGPSDSHLWSTPQEPGASPLPSPLSSASSLGPGAFSASPALSPAELERARAARRARQAASEFYLRDEPLVSRPRLDAGADDVPLRALSAAELDLPAQGQAPLVQAAPSLSVLVAQSAAAAGARGRRAKPGAATAAAALEIDRTELLPEGALPETPSRARPVPLSDDPLARIDLTTELQPHETLPVQVHRQVRQTPAPAPAAKGKKAAAGKKTKKPAAAAAATTPSVSATGEGNPKKAGKTKSGKIAEGGESEKPKVKKKKKQQQQKQEGDAAAPEKTTTKKKTKPAAGGGSSEAPALFSDAYVRGECELKVSSAAGDAEKVLVELRVHALAAGVSSVSVQAPTASPGLAVLQLPAPVASLAPGAPQVLRILLRVERPTQPSRFAAQLVYSLGQEARRVAFEVPVPASTFVQAQRLSPAQFAEALRTAGLTLVSAQLPVPEAEARNFLVALAGRLHLGLVEAVAGAASMAGRSLQGHQVLVLIKARPPSHLQFDLKTTDPDLAQALLQEAQELAARPH